MFSSRTTIWLIAALLWTILIGAIVLKSSSVSRKTIVELATVQARTSLSEDFAYQKWVAMHGGVYVPVTEKAQPNPFLAHIPERDISTPSGRMLTLINHAYIIRQIHETETSRYAIKGRLTSLNPIRPENVPDTWERTALTETARTSDIVDSVESLAGEKFLRMMFPLQLEENCFKCHTPQGYIPGTPYGGISITVPLEPFQAAIQALQSKILIMLSFVWLLGLGLILFAHRVIKNQFQLVEETLVETKTLEKKYRALFDQAAGGICVVDLDTGNIIDCNHGMAELIGRPREELIGQTMSILFPESELNKSADLLKKIWRSRGDKFGAIVEKQIIAKDGVIKDVQIKAAPLEIDEKKLLQGFFYDITAQKKMQVQAIRLSQLASVGELSAGVAHEINNPIGGVINYAQILLNKSSNDTFEQDILQKIIKEGKRIAQIVKSLLAFSHKSEEKQYVYDLEKIIREPLTLINAHIIKDGITIEVDIPESLPAVKCSPQQIEQLVMNLVNNSKYALNEKFPGPEMNKTIKISAEVTLFENNRYIRMTFVDYGTGIPAETIDNIKEQFCTTKPYGKGTGLGLSICEEIVTNHGGWFDIESEFGEFTRVAVYLPIN